MKIREATGIAKHLDTGGMIEDQIRITRAYFALISITARDMDERRENLRLAEVCAREIDKWK